MPLKGTQILTRPAVYCLYSFQPLLSSHWITKAGSPHRNSSSSPLSCSELWLLQQPLLCWDNLKPTAFAYRYLTHITNSGFLLQSPHPLFSSWCFSIPQIVHTKKNTGLLCSIEGGMNTNSGSLALLLVVLYSFWGNFRPDEFWPVPVLLGTAGNKTAFASGAPKQNIMTNIIEIFWSCSVHKCQSEANMGLHLAIHLDICNRTWRII